MAESDHFLNQPGPIGLAPTVRRPVIEGDLRMVIALCFCLPARATRAVGVVTVVAHQVFVLIGDVIQE